jgi:hypothetical protein
MLMNAPVAISIRTFCQTYCVARSFAYRLIADGRLEVRKAGAKTLIDRASAERWYANLPEFTPAPRIVKMRTTIAARSGARSG